ncbi:aromatase/cyclase [Streptomyces sp. NBC_00878]|uniref:aromatase/cyclase n=1 Tax=Streptomyces sp. NBC_00878 TaxID=2975854 RepID=UPI00225B18A9|nr:aromatase/cyclase [Streptomyces sp. NBC_00878]MCX4906883.1 aromatase/cyclase [Streptomyces sp. NBC_00878]
MASVTPLHRTEHTWTTDAPADVLYALVADVTRWPAIFEPTVHVRHIERSARSERFEIWAVMNGEVAHWTSHRVRDADRHCVTFRQEHARPPVTSMSGSWLFRELPTGKTEIVLRHRFTVEDDDPSAVSAVSAALDRNSARELAALTQVAGAGHPVDELVFAFTDTIELTGTAAEAYSFVAHAERWPDLLPHVARVRLTENEQRVQDLEMETVTADGARHTTRSSRICRPGQWIAYKQQITPRLLSGHSGEWTFTDGPSGSGAVATARHVVAIAPGAVAEVLGAHASLADARAYVREALGRNSRTTLEHSAAVRA